MHIRACMCVQARSVGVGLCAKLPLSEVTPVPDASEYVTTLKVQVIDCFDKLEVDDSCYLLLRVHSHARACVCICAAQ